MNRRVAEAMEEINRLVKKNDLGSLIRALKDFHDGSLENRYLMIFTLMRIEETKLWKAFKEFERLTWTAFIDRVPVGFRRGYYDRAKLLIKEFGVAKYVRYGHEIMTIVAAHKDYHMAILAEIEGFRRDKGWYPTPSTVREIAARLSRTPRPAPIQRDKELVKCRAERDKLKAECDKLKAENMKLRNVIRRLMDKDEIG